MLSRILVSEISARVVIISYIKTKNVWLYVCQFKYSNTIDISRTSGRSGTQIPSTNLKKKTTIQRRCSAVVEAVGPSFTPTSSLVISNSSSEQHFTIHEVDFRAYYEV